MDRSECNEYVVKGKKLASFTPIFEMELLEKGFKLKKRERGHGSVTISAQKGSYGRSFALDVLTDNLSSYFPGGNVYGAEADITEYGQDLRLTFSINPLSYVPSKRSALDVMSDPLMTLSTDVTCAKVMKDIISGLRSKGVVVVERSTSAYDPRPVGDKYVDQRGWTVEHGPEVQMGGPEGSTSAFWCLWTSLIGLFGFLLFFLPWVLIMITGKGNLFAFMCIGGLLSIVGIPGLLMSISALRSGKEYRVRAIISLIMSIPPTLLIVGLLIFIVVTVYVWWNSVI
ncbi:MAG: hypothetical protein ACMUHB_04000 [Thermoplasmatota archaeon]